MGADRYRERSNAHAVGVVTFLAGLGLASWSLFFLAWAMVL